MSGPARYSPDVSKAYSSMSLVGVVLGAFGLVIASIGVAVALDARADVAALEKRLRTAEQSITTLENRQNELDETIGDATQASAIAEALIRIEREHRDGER